MISLYLERWWLNEPFNLLRDDPSRPEVAKANSLPLGSPERSTTLQQAAQLAYESQAVLPVCQPTVHILASDKVQGADGMPWGWSGGWDFHVLSMRGA